MHNVTTAREFVENMLKYNLKYNDGAFVKLAYEATQKEDLDALLLLDQECNALKCPKEIRQASQKLGLRLIKIFKRKKQSSFMEAYEEAIRNRKATSH